jgi:hypothetical protein
MWVYGPAGPLTKQLAFNILSACITSIGKNELNAEIERKTTNFSITDEYGEKSTITLEKWAADILTKELPDIHKWIQENYDKAVDYSNKNNLETTRRKIGDMVRQKAYVEANKYIEILF